MMDDFFSSVRYSNVKSRKHEKLLKALATQPFSAL